MAYSDLSLKDRAQVIHMGVQAGLKSLKDIQSFYDSMHTEPEANEFVEGGSIHIAPSNPLIGKKYYKDGGILEGDFDVEDLTYEEIKELDRLGYSVERL